MGGGAPHHDPSRSNQNPISSHKSLFYCVFVSQRRLIQSRENTEMAKFDRRNYKIHWLLMDRRNAPYNAEAIELIRRKKDRKRAEVERKIERSMKHSFDFTSSL